MVKTAYKNRKIVRNTNICIPMNEEERKIIERDARNRGMTLASYCRQVLIYNKGE